MLLKLTIVGWLALPVCVCVCVCARVCQRRFYQKAMAGTSYHWELVDRWTLIPNPKVSCKALWRGRLLCRGRL